MISDIETLVGLILVAAGSAQAALAGWWIGPILGGVLLVVHGWWVARHGA